MRLLHGQKILEDEQLLQHLELDEKSKHQMLIEQSKEISLTIHLPFKDEVNTFKSRDSESSTKRFACFVSISRSPSISSPCRLAEDDRARAVNSLARFANATCVSSL